MKSLFLLPTFYIHHNMKVCEFLLMCDNVEWNLDLKIVRLTYVPSCEFNSLGIRRRNHHVSCYSMPWSVDLHNYHWYLFFEFQPHYWQCVPE